MSWYEPISPWIATVMDGFVAIGRSLAKLIGVLYHITGCCDGVSLRKTPRGAL